METAENHVENGELEENCLPIEQQIETEKPNLLFDYDDVDRKELEFDAHFNGDVGSGDEFDDDRSFANR